MQIKINNIGVLRISIVLALLVIVFGLIILNSGIVTPGLLSEKDSKERVPQISDLFIRTDHGDANSDVFVDDDYEEIIFCGVGREGITGEETNDGFVVQEEKGDCVVVSVLNANLQQIFDKNPGMTEEAKNELAKEMRIEFNKWVNEVNNDDLNGDGDSDDPEDSVNDIDLSDGVSPHKSRKGKFSDEFNEVMKCKNKALDKIRGDQATKPEDERLIIPEREVMTNIYKWSPSVNRAFVGRNSWKADLKEMLDRGGTAIMNLQSPTGATHTITVVGVDCESTPPTLTVIDPETGEEVTLEIELNDDGSVTITNASDIGLADGSTVISIVGIAPI